MRDTQGFKLPSTTIKDSEKNEDWHKQFVLTITNQSLNNSYAINYAAMNQAVNFYQGLQKGEEYKFLQEAEDGDVLPARWDNYNKIKVKVDLLLGELVEKGYDLKVRALNKEAKVRKLEEKRRLAVEMKLNKVAQELEGEYGLPLTSQEQLPESEEELEEYFEYNYKELSEVIMESALKYLDKVNKWEYTRLALFRDLLIMGKCFAKNEIIDGLPRTRRIDPRLMIYDVSATDDFLSDATYFGEIYYMGLAEVAAQYNLSRKELEEAYSAQTSATSNPTGANSPANSIGLMDAHNLKFFKAENGELRVLVVSATWKDQKEYSHKVSTDKYGNQHVKRVKPGTKGDNIEKRMVEIWREGTLIAGKFLRNWGEIKNQARDVDSLAKCESPYKAFIPSYLNGQGVSKVQQLQGLQNLKDIAMFNVQLAMSRAGAKGFLYDVSQVPDGWDIHNMIKYLKTVGIAFIDSRKDGIPSQFNQFTEIDLSISDSVTKYLEISAMVDREMDAISGINEARQGLIQNASQAVGVTQSALIQSNLSTAMYYRMFNTFCSNCLNYQAKLIKISWAGKDRYASIIGDVGINFLQEDITLELDDYGVFVEELPPIVEDKQTLQSIIMAALQAGQLDFLAAIKIMMEKDMKLAIRRYEREIQKQQQQQAAQQQAEQEQQMMMQQAAQEAEAAKEAQKMEAAMGIQGLKNQGNLQAAQANNMANLQGKKLDWMKELDKGFNLGK
jgi:hypothetical protein